MRALRAAGALCASTAAFTAGMRRSLSTPLLQLACDAGDIALSTSLANPSALFAASRTHPFSMHNVASSSASCESVRAPGSHYHHIPRSLPLLTCILVSALPLLNTTSLADVHILQEHFKASLPNCNGRACAPWESRERRHCAQVRVCVCVC